MSKLLVTSVMPKAFRTSPRLIDSFAESPKPGDSPAAVVKKPEDKKITSELDPKNEIRFTWRHDEYDSDKYDTDEYYCDKYDTDEYYSDEYYSNEYYSDEYYSNAYYSDEYYVDEDYTHEYDSDELQDSDGLRTLLGGVEDVKATIRSVPTAVALKKPEDKKITLDFKW